MTLYIEKAKEPTRGSEQVTPICDTWYINYFELKAMKPCRLRRNFDLFLKEF